MFNGIGRIPRTFLIINGIFITVAIYVITMRRYDYTYNFNSASFSSCSSYPSPSPSPSFATRPNTLVLYIHAPSISGVKDENFNYFLRHGLCEYCENINYAIIINSDLKFNTSVIPKHKNIEILVRDNIGGDFGGWGEYLNTTNQEVLSKKKRLMFINDTVRGPYIDFNYMRFLQQYREFHYTDLFAAHLTSKIRAVGSYINCERGFTHIQTMSFMLDDVAFQHSRHLFKTFGGYWETVYGAEIEMSRNLILNHNIGISSMLYAYKDFDFTKKEIYSSGCNKNINPSVVENGYFGINVSPMEVVFLKNRERYLDKVTNLYSAWAENKIIINV